MSLACYWAMEFVWTGPDEGSCRSITRDERYLPRLHPPGVVDRLCGYTTEIKVPGFALVLNKDMNNKRPAVDFWLGGVWIGYIRPGW